MAYALRVSESVRHGIRRVGLEQIDALIEDLENPTDSTRVHDARRRCKTLRALLCLVRGSLDPGIRRAENARWRDLARMLGRVRDAVVRLKTFRSVVTRPNACGDLAQLLADEAKVALGVVPKVSTRRRLLREAQTGRAVWENLLLQHHGWKLLKPGLCDAYRAARKAWRTAAKTEKDENFHEWRKSVKLLWNQVRLLAKVQPKKTRPFCVSLEKLGTVLGDDHDLALLRAYARSRDGRSIDILDPLVAHRRLALQRKAFKAGKRIFSDSPSEFCHRAKKWWAHFSR